MIRRVGTSPVWVCVVFVLVSLGLWAFGMMAGSDGLENPANLITDASLQSIVMDIRLPRTLGAWAAGALLGLGGAVAQGLFRNPLADPYLLGSASGASLGVAVAIALLGVSPMAAHWFAQVGLTGVAFAGALAAVLLTLTLARGVHHSTRLLLAGVIVGVVLGALTSMVLMMAPQAMQALQAFMLGSTSFVGWSACVVMLVIWLLCMVAAWLVSPVLDGLALGESTAFSLGLPLARMRTLLVVILALATATAVAHTGLIAFVGLAAPHMVRTLVRAGQGLMLLLSSLAGAVLLLAADLMGRSLLAPQELAVGILTAVLGGGYLLWLMHRSGPVSVMEGR